MIEIVMYVALGFLLAALIALLLSPFLWRRAVRLTTRRLEATMPMSIVDIQADKDQMRAEFAVQLRRAEIAYARARDNAARYLVERSRKQAQIEQMSAEMEGLRAGLNERSNELRVLEQTVNRRFPQLESEIDQARQIVAMREGELFRLSNAYANQGEALSAAREQTRRYQDEMIKLRNVLENSPKVTNSFSLRNLQSGVKEAQRLQEENQRLVAELSRLREELHIQQDNIARDTDLLKLEMKRLADQIFRAASVRKPAAAARAATAEKAADAARAESRDNAGQTVVVEVEPMESASGRRLGRRLRRRMSAAGAAMTGGEGSLVKRLQSMVSSDN